MNIIDRGDGPPIIVIPGIQGRWEWMKPAIDALADEPSSGGLFDQNRGFESYVDQVRDALDATGLHAATICGVSYGGLIAAASDGIAASVVAALRQGWRCATHMFSPHRMARRVRLLEAFDSAELASATAHPALALIITGEATLDRVVPVAVTRGYLRMWPGARTATLHRTGHLGSMMRPINFAELVAPFAQRADHERRAWRRVG